MEHQQLRTYRGNCHCGAFVYEAQLPEIKSVKQCNCSICHKKGYLWVMAESVDHFKIVKGDENTLSEYTFNAKNRRHRFCPTCATPVMALAVNAPPNRTIGLNVHAMQNVNTWELKKDPIDFAKVGPQYKIPEHKGPEPSAEIQGGKTYKGGCHCGAVTLAVTSEPLDETFEERGLECNCSVCERVACVWTYPLKEQVVLHADDPTNIGRYAFSQKLVNKTFCKVCGVVLTNEYNSERGDAELPEEFRKWDEMARTRHTMNLRAILPAADLAKVKRRYNDGWSNISPMYQNP